MNDVTLADVEAEVRKLASELPGFVYPEAHDDGFCSYVGPYETKMGDDPSQACIIGRALWRLGFGYHTLVNYEGDPAYIIVTDLLFAFHPNQENTSSEDFNTLDWLGEVQKQQDGGVPWGEAVRLADEVYGKGVYGKGTG